MRLVRGRLKTFNHLCFFILLSGDWYRSTENIKSSQLLCIFPLEGFRKALLFPSLGSYPLSTVLSLIDFRPFFNSQPWVIWLKANTQSDITSSYSSAGSLLFSPGIENLRYLIFQTPTHLVVTLSLDIPSIISAVLFTLRHTFILF